MMSSTIFAETSNEDDSENSSSILETVKSSNTRKRSLHYESPLLDSPSVLSSPNRRSHLQSMSPNVSRRVVYPNIQAKDGGLPTLKAPIGNPRSKSSIQLPSTNSLSPKHKLRRTNSLMSGSFDGLQSTSAPSDRFIPSRHNSTTSKITTTEVELHPNASPQTHIKAQTSKLYRYQVAEACGLEMHSRILQFQPHPPERKKPIDFFSNINLKSNKHGGSKRLGPAAASARAKKIPTAPERVLDAPGLVDDFYLNLLAWSPSNLLAIGLEDAVYVWNASTGSVGLLCELPDKTFVTSVRWSNDGSYISIGKDDGLLEIWDIETNTKLRTLNCDNHQTRIASQCWNQHLLTSGSRLGGLYHSDVRIAPHFVSKMDDTHIAEICGVEYRADGMQFATGGNDNLVCIWDARQTQASNSSSGSGSISQPLYSKRNHKAAVKALSWSPFQPSLLATGGGSNDKIINFWNTSTGARVNTIETGSQISSLNWGYASGTGIEIVATHGFPSNNISLYNYPTLQKTGEILGAHDSRILNGCLSPDNLTLATIAGDENLKFWSLFDLYKSKKDSSEGIDNSADSQLVKNSENKSLDKLLNIR